MRSLTTSPLMAPEGGGAMPTNIDTLCINTIRTLSMDAVQKANSGHPGTPMALAPVGYTLWRDVLNYDPANPLWPNRDRFVLSIGHASMLLYSLIYLAGIRDIRPGGVSNDRPALTLEDIEQFRQLDSLTPGHPEYHHTAGVETTTGPLGQGCGNSVGMAIAEKWLAEHYNRPGFKLFDHHIYTMCGDGDNMEGVASEAASIAGHLKLGNLTWIYDSNHISIEGSTRIAFTESVHKRFEAYGWHVLELKDANDTGDFRRLLAEAKAETSRPTLIIVHSIIGWGAPHLAGTAEAHGSPLGVEEIRETKKFYGWPEDRDFYVPDGVAEHFQAGIATRGAAASKAWDELFAAYRAKYPAEAAQLDHIFAGTLPEGWDRDIPVFDADAKGVASRASSGKVLNEIAKNYPWMIGGSADLSPSTKTHLTFDGAGDFQPPQWGGTYGGRNLHFGVREHAMGSISNGLALYGIRAYCSGFLIFSDYMKPPIRLSSLMKLPVTYIFTHDSIGVGEDGPTHQPIEQLAQLRATPGVTVLRPADANEVAEAWRTLVQITDRPSVLALSRQNLPTICRKTYAPATGLAKGAYVLADADGRPDVILMATGSEVGLIIKAAEKLKADGIKVRLVSMPSWDLFEAQPKSYRDSVLPPDITARVAVEQAAQLGWDRYTGLAGETIVMHGFGASAPAGQLEVKFGFTVDAVVAAARRQAGK
ncbi:transketolase [Komagataeibacter oboediens]|uniref:Transketolase n=1 Tax=Komagataeibacter oboediens TaxID=65958 RepID=A0ABS5SIX4_9PROT|nr:transketolase [Komagataeibacter oboediens]MBL7232850.1 transketolase [Komagataeibacter oboediens]MBT0674173.1 transketolase [Komagataeibacter oboediens]MBT0679334.1 transketolase [Komagataeibacter oboediens]